MSHHIGNYISSNTQPLAAWRQFARMIPRTSLLVLTFFVAVISMLSSLSANSRAALRGILDKEANIDKALSSIKEIDDKVNLIIKLQVAKLNDENVFIFLKPISLMGAYLLFYTVLSIRKRSYMSMNDYSINYYRGHELIYNFVVSGLLLATILAVLTGIFTSWLYDHIKIYLPYF